MLNLRNICTKAETLYGGYIDDEAYSCELLFFCRLGDHVDSGITTEADSTNLLRGSRLSSACDSSLTPCTVAITRRGTMSHI